MLSKIHEMMFNMQYDEMISSLHRFVIEEPKAYTYPLIKKWIKHRYYDLFLKKLEKDSSIRNNVQNKLFLKIVKSFLVQDKFSLRQKLANKYIMDTENVNLDLTGPEVELPDLSHMTLIFCPGLLTTLVPVMAYSQEFEYFQNKYNLNILQSDSHPVRSCEDNTQDIFDTIVHGVGRDAKGKIIPMKQRKPPQGDIIFVGYSKGGPDIFTFLVKYPEFAERTKAIITFAGANVGSPSADMFYDLLTKISFIPTTEIEALIVKIMTPVIPINMLRKIKQKDIPGAIESLTTKRNQKFWKDYGDIIDSMNIPIFTISAGTTIYEVPYFQAQSKWLLNNFDERNDMQVLYEDSLVPLKMGIPTGYLHLHHWDIAYQEFPSHTKLFSNKVRHCFPRLHMFESLLELLYELGIFDLK